MPQGFKLKGGGKKGKGAGRSYKRAPKSKAPHKRTKRAGTVSEGVRKVISGSKVCGSARLAHWHTQAAIKKVSNVIERSLIEKVLHRGEALRVLKDERKQHEKAAAAKKAKK